LTKCPKRLIPSASKDALRGEGFVGAAKLDIRYQVLEGGIPSAGVHAARSAAPSSNKKITSRSAAVDHVRSLPPDFESSLLALFLDHQFNLLSVERLGEGSAADCGLQPVALVHQAAKLGAVGFVLIHHAPQRSSGGSREEYRITREIRMAGEDFEIHLLDHLILAGSKLFDISP